MISKAKIKNKDRFKMEIDILKKLVSLAHLRTTPMLLNCSKPSKTTSMYIWSWKYARGVNYSIGSRRQAVSPRNLQPVCSNRSSRLFSIATRTKFVTGNIAIDLRDLKPENFLFENKSPDSTLKVIDFGLSKIYDDPSKKSSL